MNAKHFRTKMSWNMSLVYILFFTDLKLDFFKQQPKALECCSGKQSLCVVLGNRACEMES